MIKHWKCIFFFSKLIFLQTNISNLPRFNSTCPPSGNLVDGLPLVVHNTNAEDTYIPIASRKNVNLSSEIDFWDFFLLCFIKVYHKKVDNYIEVSAGINIRRFCREKVSKRHISVGRKNDKKWSKNIKNLKLSKNIFFIADFSNCAVLQLYVSPER